MEVWINIMKVSTTADEQTDEINQFFLVRSMNFGWPFSTFLPIPEPKGQKHNHMIRGHYHDCRVGETGAVFNTARGTVQQCLLCLVESEYNLIFPWMLHPFVTHVPAKSVALLL